MIFTGQTPLSQYYVPPDYVDNPADRARLAMLGYKPSGEQNTWGKIQSWVNPAFALGYNKIAQNVAKGSEDTMHNIQEDWDNRLAKAGIWTGAAMAVGGAVTGNPQLIASGLQMGTKFGGQLAFDQNDLVTEGQAIYR